MLYYVKASLQYKEAREWCHSLGAQLVELWSEQEYQDVRNYICNLKFINECFILDAFSFFLILERDFSVSNNKQQAFLYKLNRLYHLPMEASGLA